MSDKIARVLNKSGAARAAALDISKTFNRVCHAGILHKFSSYGILGQIFRLISSFLSNRQLWVVLSGKPSQEYPVNAGVPQSSNPTSTFFYYILMTFMMMLSVMLLSMLMILLSALNLIRHLTCGNN